MRGQSSDIRVDTENLEPFSLISVISEILELVCFRSGSSSWTNSNSGLFSCLDKEWSSPPSLSSTDRSLELVNRT